MNRLTPRVRVSGGVLLPPPDGNAFRLPQFPVTVVANDRIVQQARETVMPPSQRRAA